MGLVCCRGESPCGSAEERSGLLTDESKANMPTSETVVVGTCGLGTEDDMRKPVDEASIKANDKDEVVQMTQNLENGKLESSNTQENGPVQKESIQTSSPHKGSEIKENLSTAQDENMKKPPGDSEQDKHLQCTLVPQQKLQAAADLDNFTTTTTTTTTDVSVEENPALVQDRVPDGDLLRAEAVCSEKPSHTEPNATREHSTESTPYDNDDEAGSRVTNDNAVDEPSGEYFQKPNTWLAPAACQVSSSSVVSQDISKEAQNPAVTEGSSNESSALSEQASAEDLKRSDVPKCSGPEPAGVTHSGERQDSVSSVRDPQATGLADASESLKPTQYAKPDPESLKEATSLKSIRQDAGEETMPRVHDEDGDASKTNESDLVKKKEPGDTPSEDEVQDAEVAEKEDTAKDDLRSSEEDLYRGAEELAVSQNNKSQPSPVLEMKYLKVEDRCSLAPAMDILSYSEREWKGNTAKSALIRKGYKEMSQRFGSLRRVRGDNYCALRATLFQLLSHSTQMPTWLQDEDFVMLPKQLEAEDGLISQWTFPGDCLLGDGTGDATQQLKGYMKLLQNTWQEAVDCPSAVERQQLCERVFQGGEEELGLLEALKLLMLGRAVELHGCMQSSGDVPVFCWLLFARDSSTCPRSFLCNHLSHVGLSAGLEQVEMFLLGYALQCTIQVYRLYKADTEEFVTYYPDDHRDEWPSVSLVTEDDRHYNVPVVEAADPHEELSVS